ncbi:helix-turn-helix domain-containing protein [Limibacter armeniacum]|uniref:helix-turn-helix domain-containing protein n=1 Tax=Limibacter armeniacum TaxID=466084 RepID=UPI002FE639CB
MRLHNEHRRQISLMLEAGKSLAAIARALGVHRSTVSREVARNSEADGRYLAFQANRKAHLRRMEAGIKSYRNRQPQPMPKGGISTYKRSYHLSLRFVGVTEWTWRDRLEVRKPRKRVWWWHDMRSYRSRYDYNYKVRKAWLNLHRKRDWWDMYCENSERYRFGRHNYFSFPTGTGKSIRQKPYRERPYIRMPKYWWWLYKKKPQECAIEVKIAIPKAQAQDEGILLYREIQQPEPITVDTAAVEVKCRSGPGWAA